MHSPFYNAMLISVAMVLMGCEPMHPVDRTFFSDREQQRADRERMMRDATHRISSEDLIKLVQQSAAPDGEGTYTDWIERQLSVRQGQIMFPRWEAGRRGSNKQEIAFRFVWINQNNDMHKLMYAWDVDVLEMTVGAVRFIQIEEAASPDRHLADQQERRIRTHEEDLR